MEKHVSTTSRRSFLAGAAAAIAAPVVLGSKRAAAKSDTVTIVQYGGQYQEATVKAVFEPFTKETGINVNIVPYPGLDKVKAMQLTNNVEIDIDFISGAEAASGSKQGLWEKLDFSGLDLGDLAVQPKSDYLVFDIYNQGIAWDPKKFGPGKHPVDFAGFFDVKKYPGRRSMRNYAQNTLEVALIADGVAPKDIYPLDLDRAFKSLDRIKSHIVWSPTPVQDSSLLQVGEADFGIVNSTRVKASIDPGGGVPLEYSFEQNILGRNALTILKGAPNRENAMKLIAFYLRPEIQAQFENLVFTTPISKKAAMMLSPEARKWQPDLNSPKNVMLLDSYWADNFEATTSRFKEWRLT
ncbi:putative spermidine/putrescine transport system substrate-binding protein [Bradyrhizobium sp. USDA 4341]